MIAWALETLIATTALMLLVLVVRKPVRRAFGPDLAYALWALPVLRMLLPPLPDSWRASAVTPIAQASDVVVDYIVVPLGVPGASAATPVDATAASAPEVWLVLLAAWAIGATGFLAYHLVTHSRFCARVKRFAGVVRMTAAGNVQVIETAAANGPLAFGVWRKYVAFPRDFAERYDPLERDLALAHELGHHARGDLIANWVALVMLGLHWFNPVAWRAYRAFRADQELACDALVLAGRAAGLRQAYGRAIVKSAHGGAVSAACHLHTINELKGRLKMLTKHEKTSRPRLLAGGGAVAALTLASLGLTASGTQAAERVRSGIEKTTGVDIAALELPPLPQVGPVPPVPPAPPAVGAVPAPPAPPAAPEAIRRKHKVIVMRDKDGKVTTREFDGGDDDAFALAAPDGKVRTRRFVMRSKDGKPFAWHDGDFKGMPPEAMAQLRDMPEVKSMNCGEGERPRGEPVIRSKDGAKPKVIICTNRIERMASLAADRAHFAELDAVRIERDAKASALRGLRSARESVARAEDMADARRATALKAIDEAIAEMESGKD